ncbi:flippase [Vibrio metschnikovii]|uniref:flippase n=1 Tax=Vibrio metschnikovii TaxID=28172 RepID=UPI001C2F324E|nr:flippase [Vibrio metschnikovii]
MFIKIQSVLKHQGFLRYFKNTSWLIAEQFLRIIAGLLVGIWVARYLGPQQFGLFSYALAFTAIFAGIAKLGLDGIIVRELINHPDKRDAYLGTAFWLKVMGSIIVMLLMAAVIPFTNNDATTNLFIFIIACGLVFQSFEVVEFYFQSQVLAKLISICKIIQLSLSSLIKIYLVITEAELIWFVLVTTFDALSLAICYFSAYRLQKATVFYTCFNFIIAKRLLKDSWPLIFSSIVVMIYMRIDQIMIKQMLGEYEVGIYSAAIRLSEAFYFIPTIITASLFPAILNAKKISHELYMLRMQRLYTMMVWTAIIIAIPITIFSDWIVFVLYGNDYSTSADILMIHVWSGIFVFLTVSSGKYLTSEGLTRKIFYRNLSGMILNVMLNFKMIPLYGGVGAALATLASWFLAGYLYDFMDRTQWDMAKQKSKAFLGAIK